MLLPSHISVRELARRLGRDHTAKRIASVVCLLHRRQKYWLHVEDDGAALDTPGEMYVFDRLSRVILPHRVAGRYAARHAGRTPVWQELEPLHVPRAPISGGAAGATGGTDSPKAWSKAIKKILKGAPKQTMTTKKLRKQAVAAMGDAARCVGGCVCVFVRRHPT